MICLDLSEIVSVTPKRRVEVVTLLSSHETTMAELPKQLSLLLLYEKHLCQLMVGVSYLLELFGVTVQVSINMILLF